MNYGAPGSQEQEIVLSCGLEASADSGICIWQGTINVHTHVHPRALSFMEIHRLSNLRY